MHKEIKNYCSTCHLCQTKKHLGQVNRAPLKPIIVNEPWTVIGIDVSGPHRVTANGNVFIILAGDYHSKFCVGKAVPNFTVATTAQFVFEEIICKFGMPRTIISDHGVNFMAKMFGVLCELCKIKRANSSFYHPAGNGLIERMVKTLKQILTMFVDSSHSNWDWFLQASLSAYNTTVHSSLKFSPYEVLFGRKPKIVADVILAKPVDEQELDMNDYVVKLKNNASRLREVVNNNLKKAYEKQKFQYDKFVHMGKQFEVGDLVLVRNERNKVGESKCFKERAIGPFQIMDKFNSVNFRIINLSNGKEQTIHYNRLLQYNQRVGSEFLISNQVNNEKVNEARRLDPQKSLFDVEVENLTQYMLLMELMGNSAHPIEPIVVEYEEEDGSPAVGSSCQVCGKSFASKKRLENHVNSCHNEQFNLNSEAVIEAVASAGMDEESQENFNLIKCSVCLRAFKGERGLKIHLSKVTKDHAELNAVEVESSGLEESLYS